MLLKETKKIWMNGKFVDWKDAKIHVLSHGLHYGSGVFEGLRCYKTKRGSAIFRLNDHIERLENSAKIYLMKIPYSKEELCNAIKDLISVNGLAECYIRVIAYYGYGTMDIIPRNCPVDVAIASLEGEYFKKENFENGIRVKISSFCRIPQNSLPMNAKATGQYINSILCRSEAINLGYDEAIILDSNGFISEASGENIFLIKDKKIYTPPISASILPGITRDSIIKIANDLGYDVSEQNITRGFLYSCDEAFLSGTAAEIIPIREADFIKIGKGIVGNITREIQKEYLNIVHGENKRYEDWLSYID
ncbi:MAG: branched-chain amino acid transaminase [Candidatus Altiarchaeota archaeon]